GFIQHEAQFQLVALTALQPNSNLFVAPDGRWLAGYVPALLRGHPFGLARPEGSTEAVLCIDETSGLIVAAGAGEPFFTDDGQPAQAIKDVMNFLARVEHDRVLTQKTVDALQAANLIQPWALTVKHDEAAVQVAGIFRIDEAALNTLDENAWLTLRRSAALPVAYAQLFSMNQISALEQASVTQTQLRSVPPPPSPLFRQPAPALKDIGFSFSAEETLRFDWE
ncbi:SapC family protein, partial [Chromatium okenii]|uniref:SapC family protein n=1 Tax=Chromatium okenii TaxID=61644 RepID=UPI0026EB6C21